MTSTLVIRRAEPRDAAVLGTIAAETFVEKFGHLYPPEDLRAYLLETYAAEKQRAVLENPAYAAWLLERDGAAVGHALAGPCGLPHPEVRAGDGELKRLYVSRVLYNGGWGTRLFLEAMRWLEEGGPRRVWLGVWSENVDAQRFYQRHGFSKVGEYLYPVGETRDLEFIFRRG